MKTIWFVRLFGLLLTVLLVAPGGLQSSDDATLAVMHDVNDDLRAMLEDIRIESVEFFTVGQERYTVRVLNKPTRWVPDDPRRDADGSNITYIVDPSWGEATASGLSQAATEGAIDKAFATWTQDPCLSQLQVVKRPYPGEDITVFDFFLGTGDFGNPFAADIVHGGFFSTDSQFMDSSTLAIAVTFIFVNSSTGEPTDLNSDGHLDTAAMEIYYNDAFRWSLGGSLPEIDVETVALHENGHALGVGHFGPPPEAVMNPVYVGVRQSLFPIDEAGMCSVWESWPNI